MRSTSTQQAVCQNGGLTASIEHFLLILTCCLRLKFGAKNPPLRQAADRQTV